MGLTERDIVNIEQLIQLSPVPVKFIADNIMSSKFINIVTFGRYIYSNGKSFDVTIPRIEILNSLNYHKKIGTLLHEIGHAKCDEKNCKCITSNDSAESEIHAYKYTLEQLLKYKLKKSLKQEIHHIKNQLERDDFYGRAAKHIMKLKLWQECLAYAKPSLLQRIIKWNKTI